MSDFTEYSGPLQNAINRMAEQMARPENVRKNHWNTIPVPVLMVKLMQNALAMLSDDWQNRELRAANVSNYAWMIVDNLRNGKP